jgi:hypothetical protein
MDNDQTLSDKEQLDLAQWLISRYDNLRSLTASRASFVISADAVLLAGTTFVIDGMYTRSSLYNDITMLIMASSIGVSLLLLTVSLWFAASSIMFIWQRGRKSMGLQEAKPTLFFYSRGTVEALTDPETFRKKYRTSTQHELTDYALTELRHIMSGTNPCVDRSSFCFCLFCPFSLPQLHRFYL